MDANLPLFVGRFHPLLIHLPIALILVLAVVETVALLRRQALPDPWLRLLLFLCAGSAIAAVVCGWLLAGGGGYDAQLLERHRWLGTAVAALTVAACGAHALGSTVLYRSVVVLALAVLGAASHLGGSITHGTTYLTEFAPEPLRTMMGGSPPAPPRPPVEDPLHAEVIADVIQPILATACIDCHGPGKQQGDLRLDSPAALLKGGVNGPVVVAGHPERSELLRRLSLPEDDRQRMPPAGRPGLSFEDATLLRWWIQAGALDHGEVGPLDPPGTVLAVLAQRFHPATPTTHLDPAQARALARQLGDSLAIEVRITEVEGRPEATVNASVAAGAFGDVQLARLSPLGPVLVDLRLGGTAITVKGLSALGSLSTLRSLDLSRTAIDDGVGPALSGMLRLEALNLYGTRVGDPLLTTLRRLPQLRRVYLWQTAVTADAAAAFATAQTDQRRIEDVQRRIEGLQQELRRSKVVVDLGATSATSAAIPTPSASASAAVVVSNTTCPFTGKPVDPAFTRTVDGVTIGYCCAKCLKKATK